MQWGKKEWVGPPYWCRCECRSVIFFSFIMFGDYAEQANPTTGWKLNRVWRHTGGSRAFIFKLVVGSAETGMHRYIMSQV